MKILLVEDEKKLLDDIADSLRLDGNICETATHYQAALEKVNLYDYDCILLDLSLPGGDGMNLLAELKRIGRKDGILIISARHALEDKLLGLNLGADDYLVKPFHMSELKSRIMAIVRRKNFQGNNVINFNELQVDTLSMQTTVCDIPVNLTRKEYDLLVYFLANQQRVVAKHAIAEHLWGDEMDMSADFDFIYTHIKNLRKKLMEAGSKDYIKSVYGVGYKFEYA